MTACNCLMCLAEGGNSPQARRANAMKHPLVNRTSPKGVPFIGTCAACGKAGITFECLSSEECDNVRGMTQEQAVIEAVMGDDRK